MIAERDRLEAIGRVRALVAAAGGSCHVVRLSDPEYVEAEARIFGTTLNVTIGPDKAGGHFHSPTVTRWGRERRTVDDRAEGPIGPWLLWVALGIALAAGKDQ